MQTTTTCDILIAGGGLAGGLIALALAKMRPDLDVRIVEPAPTLGGNHIWSFFDSDVADRDRWLVDPLICHRWADYDIAFPAHSRRLDVGYQSIASQHFDKVVRNALPADRIIVGSVENVSATTVTLTSNITLSARHVIDARGPGDLSTLDLGWQKFVGQTLRISGGHGLTRPIVMDATVAQIDGYRFLYCLPLDADTLFVEDTYYSDTPDLNVDAVRDRIADYAADKGWQIAARGHEETGVLPVVMGGDFDAYWASTGVNIGKAGLRAGLFHATTGYSLPDAVRLAVTIVKLVDFPPQAFAAALKSTARAGWRRNGFYRMLDTMLFRAAEPGQRYKVLERFYRLSPALIGRFYAGQSTTFDKIRVLSGRPPVPIWAAMRALLGARSVRPPS